MMPRTLEVALTWVKRVAVRSRATVGSALCTVAESHGARARGVAVDEAQTGTRAMAP